jgi:predicted acylesterase/phospholipase RssA
MMTTNLMLRRPYSLPFQDRVYMFKLEDFEKIFPKRIMSYLTRVCEPFKPEAGEVGTYYKVLEGEKLPIIVAARMSLSFPVLISAVPLYARDRTMKANEARKLHLCLFSDGGLSSNFPIHFFDRMLPNAPTFAISLDQYDIRRDRAVDGPVEAQNPVQETRVWMPATDEAGGGILLPNQSFEGLLGSFRG